MNLEVGGLCKIEGSWLACSVEQNPREKLKNQFKYLACAKFLLVFQN